MDQERAALEAAWQFLWREQGDVSVCRDFKVCACSGSPFV